MNSTSGLTQHELTGLDSADPFGEQIYVPPTGQHRAVGTGHGTDADQPPPGAVEADDSYLDSTPLPPLPRPLNGAAGPRLIPPAGWDDDAVDNLIPPPPLAPTHEPAEGPDPPSSRGPAHASCPACAAGIDPFAAWGLAGSFARNVLSWDEANPERWARALSRFVPDNVDPRALGFWDGTGRQRVDCVLPERLVHEGPGKATVRVRVWIVPYSGSPRSPAGPGPAGPPPVITPTVESSVPPPAAAGWRGHDAYEALLAVPITTEAGAVAIDAKRLIPADTDNP